MQLRRLAIMPVCFHARQTLGALFLLVDGNSDFDVRQRFVFSYVYDLPVGRGHALVKGASGVVNTNDVSAANGDCGGTVGGCSRPNLVGNPNAKPCIPGTIFDTSAFLRTQASRIPHGVSHS